jgi:hypothetical protein
MARQLVTRDLRSEAASEGVPGMRWLSMEIVSEMLDGHCRRDMSSLLISRSMIQGIRDLNVPISFHRFPALV